MKEPRKPKTIVIDERTHTSHRKGMFNKVYTDYLAPDSGEVVLVTEELSPNKNPRYYIRRGMFKKEEVNVRFLGEVKSSILYPYMDPEIFE